MANIYPAIKAKMGLWDYFIVKMKMKEVAKEVSFAHEVDEDNTLDEMIQRVLDERRAKTEILKYLTGREDRFFSSIVVAAIGGSPGFTPVDIADDPQFAILSQMGIDGGFGFGVLTFNGDQSYYALDGQHRLKAIKTVVDPSPDEMELVSSADSSIADEEVSVLMVMPGSDDTDEGFKRRYRRLFSSLNRYAKPMDQFTNIIMDEDDAFAIITRRLIGEHEMFKSPGREAESFKVKVKKGKNLRANDSWFVTLEGLYEYNKMLLMTPGRELAYGWNNKSRLKEYTQFRPDEDVLDSYFSEISIYWSSLFSAIPNLGIENIPEYRNHGSEVGPDYLYFWPIGMEMLVNTARMLLNDRLADPDNPTIDECTSVLTPLNNINWELHDLPWKGLLLVNDGTGWKMRNEDRTKAIEVAKMILYVMVSDDSADEDTLNTIRDQWEQFVYPKPNDMELNSMWNEIVEIIS